MNSSSFRIGKRFFVQTILFALLVGPVFADDAQPVKAEQVNGRSTGAQKPPAPRLRVLPPAPIPPGERNQIINEVAPVLMPASEKKADAPGVQTYSAQETIPAAGTPGPVLIPAQPPQPTALAENPAEPPELRPSKPAQKLEPGTAVLNFNEASLKDILRTVADITGENFVIAPGVNAKITVQTTKPVPKKEMFSIFESILELNGLSAVKAGPYYKIVQAASARQRGLDLLNGPRLADLQNGDGLVNAIVPIEFISANDVMQILKPMLSQAGNITVYTKTNTLILTDSSSNIRKSLEFIETLDVDAFKRMHMEMVPVTNVDIKTLNKEIAEILSALGFGKDTTQLSIVPIERLNSLLVLSSNTQLLSSVKEWLERLDKRASGESSSIHTYYVQNDKASNVKTILEQLFSGKRPAGLASPGAAMALSPVGEDVKIFLYEPSNALIIQSSQRDYQTMLSTIQELDRIPKQVLIDALILEVKLDETTKFGIQWSALTDNFNLQQNTGIFSSIINDPRGAISAPIGAGAPSGLTAFTTDSSRFFAAIQALATTGKINVLSNPHIVVKNYEKASINVGSDEPVATQSTQTAVTGTGGLIQNIEYRKTGVILTVTPHITEGGMVAMTVRQEVSDKSTDRTVGDRTYPSFTKREAETSIVAKDRQTLVIGGLIQERKDRTDSGIPFLSKIPVLGNLFKFSTRIDGKTELIILITPRVISDSAQASLATDEVRDKLEDLKNQLKNKP